MPFSVNSKEQTQTNPICRNVEAVDRESNGVYSSENYALLASRSRPCPASVRVPVSLLLRAVARVARNTTISIVCSLPSTSRK